MYVQVLLRVNSPTGNYHNYSTAPGCIAAPYPTCYYSSLRYNTGMDSPYIDQKTSQYSAVPWNLRDVSGAILLVLVGTLLLFIIGGLVALVTGSLPALAVIVLSLALELLLIFGVWKFGLRRYGKSWSALGLIPSLNNGALLALLVLLASLALTFVYGIVVTFFGQDILAPEPLPGDLTETVLHRLAGFVVVVLLAPFAEEVFFRGFLLPAFANRWGFLVGAIISSGLFGISHVAPGSIVPAFMSGMLFAWLYHRTGSLWNTTIAHGAQNSLAFALTTPV